MRKRPYKVIIAEKAMRNVPPSDRAQVEAKLREMLQNFDPKETPGKPIRPLPKLAKTCPDCGAALEFVTTLCLPATSERARERWVDVLDCNACDESFAREALS